MAHLSTKTTTKDEINGSRKPDKKKNRQKPSSSFAESTNSPTRDHSPSKCQFPLKYSLSPLLSQKALNYPTEEENSLASLMLQRSSQRIPWRWSRIRKGIQRRKLISLRQRRSTDGANQRSTSSKGQALEGHASSEEDSRDRDDRVNRDNISAFSLNYACLTSHNCQQKCTDIRTCGEEQCHLSASLSNKYQPKVFQEIVGHEMTVKALTNAVQKKKIVPLYLFHGPSGTGKTSTARIFVMALNCESMACNKPCWSCRGCSRSLYTMDLCTGSRTSGFERIRTLLQNTTFTQIVSGFKVFIVEECHSLVEDAWEEILSIAEKGYGSAVVFILITEDANMIPRTVSSRCQKFCFSKLNDMDITLKLGRILAQEKIQIERDALKLIVSKADGSMREAENILDQLALLGSRIKSSMVQQIVGLVPHSKLLDLLTTVISADTIKTVRFTRELIASGVQPKSLLSQLASLITDILSGPSNNGTISSKEIRLSMNGPDLTSNQYESLSHALKILVETEKQMSASSDHTTWVVAALMQITSELISNRITNGIVLPIIPLDDDFNVGSRQNSIQSNNRLSDHKKSRKYHLRVDTVPEQLDITTNDPGVTTQSTYKSERCPTSGPIDIEPNLGKVGDMDEIWQNILARMQSTYVKEFLSKQGTLASLTISSANAIVHLMFKRSEDRLAAQTSEETIANALKNALGCPVIVNMSIEPMQLEIVELTDTTATKSKATDSGHSRQQQGLTQFPPASQVKRSSSAGVAMRRSKSQNSYAVSENLKLMRLKENTQILQGSDKFTGEGQERSAARSQQILPFSGPLMQVDEEDAYVNTEKDPSTHTTATIKTTKHKHRWLSLSSIQQGDASVEPYSQDLLFENANTNRERRGRGNSKVHKDPQKNNENQHCQTSATPIGLQRSWSCSNIFCQEEAKVKNHGM